MTITLTLTPAEQRQADEAEAVRTEKCSHCSARPNQWCTAQTRSAHPHPYPSPASTRPG